MNYQIPLYTEYSNSPFTGKKATRVKKFIKKVLYYNLYAKFRVTHFKYTEMKLKRT